MSNEVHTIVCRRKVGSPTRKAILLYMADRASDDGSGVWTSKANIARDLEMDRRTVQRAIADMVEKGLIECAGKRESPTGWTNLYNLQLVAIRELESTRPSPSSEGVAQDHPVAQDHGRGGTGPREGVAQDHPNHPYNHPITTLNVRTPSFSDFWEVWPNKNAKQKGEVAWKKLKPAEKVEAVDRAAVWFARWRKGHPDASPILPASFLNGKRWQDEAPAQSEQASKYRKMGRA